MNSIEAVVRNGKVEVSVPANWPDGCSVVVMPANEAHEKVGMDESEWRDDPQSIAEWIAYVDAIEPLILTPEEIAENERFEKIMREYNIEAVRRQFEQGFDS